jgi:hypothetical protein
MTILPLNDIQKRLDSFINHDNVGTIFPENFFTSVQYHLSLLQHAIVACESSAKTFRWYEEMHRAKPDHEKADRNRDFALEQEGILNRAREIGAK